MLCRKCAYSVAYAEDLRSHECVVCGNMMTPTTDDVFKRGMYNLVTEKRETQLLYARDVQDLVLMNERGTALLEAGTGVGKSYAYFVPAVLTGERVIISTATKNLQEQLSNDLPKIMEKMGIAPNISIFKGANNYACSRLSKKIKIQTDQVKFEKWAKWYHSRNKPADISNWKGTRPPWWSDISAENCPDKKGCEFATCCRPSPQNYQILIVNHALLAIDLLLMTPGSLFGEYDVLIVDEGHKAPSFFRNALTGSLTKTNIKNVLDSFKFSIPLQTIVDGAGSKYVATDMTADLKRILGLYTKIMKALSPTKKSKRATRVSDLSEVEHELQDLVIIADIVAGNLKYALRNAHGEIQRFKEHGKSSMFLNSVDELHAAISTGKRLMTRVEGVTQTATRIFTSGEDADLVTIDSEGLHVQPIDIGVKIGPRLEQITYKVFTSATLKTGESFDHFKNAIGIKEDKDTILIEKAYEGSFDYDKQVQVYMPTELPPPRYDEEGRTKWVDAQAHEIHQLIQGTQGDALILFTAKKDLEEVWNALDRQSLEAAGLNLIQQEGDAAYALKAYQKTPHSVLFGLKSFWEGVDLPGRQLRLVVVTKLPFPPQDDPLFQALRQKADKEAFNKVDIPEMITDMRQATGRLIRTQTDHGVVALLDPRVWTGGGGTHYTVLNDIKLKKGRPQGYGWRLIQALGYRKRAKTFTEAIAFANK